MSGAEVAARIKAALEDCVDTDPGETATFLAIDVIDGEPGTLGVEANDGSRFFVVVEEL